MGEGKVRYAVVIEEAGKNYSASVPDIPGCVAAGPTLQDTMAMIRDAIELHLGGLHADDLPNPPASSRVGYVEVAV